MKIYKAIESKLKIAYEKKTRELFCKKKYSNLHNLDFSILSQNCWGGVLTQDLNLPYSSPTVNMYFTAPDFVKFLENLDYYLSLELKECDKSKWGIDVAFPVGMLDDICLYFVHYHSFEECKEKWTRRIARINRDNLYVAMTDRDGGNQQILERFAALPYKKVFFSHIPHLEYDFVVYIPGFENDGQVGDVTSICNKGQRLTDPYFNPIEWLNK